MLIGLILAVGLVLVYNYCPQESMTKGVILVIVIAWITSMVQNGFFDGQNNQPRKLK